MNGPGKEPPDGGDEPRALREVREWRGKVQERYDSMADLPPAERWRRLAAEADALLAERGIALPRHART